MGGAHNLMANHKGGLGDVGKKAEPPPVKLPEPQQDEQQTEAVEETTNVISKYYRKLAGS